MIMLTEEEFAIHVNGYCQCGCTEPLIAHDREQRAEIELLSDIIRRAAWLEQAPEEGSPYIDFESYARATEESEALRARAEKAEKERDEAREALRARDACRRVDFRFTDGELRAALRNVQPGTRDESLIHVAACAALDFSARAEKAEAALDAQIKAAEDDCHRWDEMERRIATEKSRADRAEAQLPEGMSHCTIVFRECALGHGWLTATNWTPFGCPTCAIHSERARADRLEAKLKKLIDGDGK